MATVNLGSIKFKWKGTYNGATAYTVDDVVEYNGSSYICILASTGNLPTNATYFEQMSSAGTNGTDGTDLGTTLTTQGDIVYRDASGLQRLGAGTSGQVLQTGGTGANPSWGTVSSDFVRLGQVNQTSFTNSISVDFFTTDYDIFKVFVTGLNGSSAGHESAIRFNSSAGTAVTGSNYRYVFTGGYRNNSGGSSASQIISGWDASYMSLSNVSPNAYEQGNHEITVYRPMNASEQTKVIVTGGGYENNFIYDRHGQGFYNNVEAHTGITFLATSGTISIEHIEVYGIK